MKYIRTYSDSHGESHFDEVEVEFTQKDFAPPAPPFLVSPFNPALQYAYVSIPDGWYGEWHPAPHRQLSILLSGQLDIETSDGEIRRFMPGDIHFMDDINGKGHRTRVIGSSGIVAAMIQVPD